ncbi:MAG: hypothetical protein J0651_02130, partial [Actinobacteria bacterium]|nr:hypothetical protein [Actinomycetota bacterium]
MAIDNSAIVQLANTLFIYNFVREGSVIAITNSRLSLLITNSAFQDNEAATVLQCSDSSNLLLLSASITGSPQAFALVGSELEVHNSSFSGLTRLASAVLASVFTVFDSTVAECSGGSIETESQSKLTLSRISFSNFQSEAAILSVADGVALLSDLKVQNGLCAIFLSVQRASVNITASTFSHISGQICKSIDASFFILSDSYLGNLNNTEEALDLRNSQQIQLKSVQVNKVSSADMGIRLAGIQVTVDNCQFHYILGKLRGAVLIQA